MSRTVLTRGLIRPGPHVRIAGTRAPDRVTPKQARWARNRAMGEVQAPARIGVHASGHDDVAAVMPRELELFT